ncbi:flagellar protein FlhE [Salinisphaera aquimarina]|uniref:Flagellar protein FlhE n=1 Tax=Salinisphaera aquimarina TaxID=2094031 RepID=A0ABV7ES23_9GAMM
MFANPAYLLLVAALLASVPMVPARAAGSWVADATTPTLRQRGWRYDTRILKPRASTPLVGRGITSVSWRYEFGNSGRPPRVALCAGRRCIEALTPTGRSTAFAGLAPATPFRFVFILPGRGMLATPRRGGPLQLVVNFE